MDVISPTTTVIITYKYGTQFAKAVAVKHTRTYCCRINELKGMKLNYWKKQTVTAIQIVYTVCLKLVLRASICRLLLETETQLKEESVAEFYVHFGGFTHLN